MKPGGGLGAESPRPGGGGGLGIAGGVEAAETFTGKELLKPDRYNKVGSKLCRTPEEVALIKNRRVHQGGVPSDVYPSVKCVYSNAGLLNWWPGDQIRPTGELSSDHQWLHFLIKLDFNP